MNKNVLNLIFTNNFTFNRTELLSKLLVVIAVFFGKMDYVDEEHAVFELLTLNYFKWKVP